MSNADQPAASNLPQNTDSVSRGTSSPDPAIAAELATLRARIDALEQRLGIAPPIAEPHAAPIPTSVRAPVQTPEPRPALLEILDAGTPNAPPPAALAPQSSAQRLSFEQLVGTRWYAAAGALALVVGLALFAKLAYDQGWLRVPPGPRCVLVAVVGALLIGAGEVVRRRFTRVGSIGLFAAGLGALYAAPLAATRLYDLIHPGLAFLLLIAVSSLGVVIAARLRFILVAFISLVGAYMAPILLSTGEPSYLVYPAYLLLLLATGLFISAFLRGDFVHIRTLVWYATILLGGFWTLDDGVESPIDGLSGVLFIAIAWLLIHAELLWAARQQANPELPRSTPRPAPRPFWRALALSLSTSTWAGVLVTVILRHTGLMPDWTGVAGFAMGSAFAALALAGHLRFMVDAPRSETERLGAVLGVEAAAMLIIAIALGLTGLGEIIAYTVMAAAVLVAANWLRSLPLLIYGCVVASILTARLIVYDSTTGLHASPVLLAGLALTTWTGLMLGAAAIWTFAAWIVLGLANTPSRDDEDEPSFAPVASISIQFARGVNAALLIAGVVCAVAAILHLDASAASITTAWLALAAALAFCGALLPRWPLPWVGLIPLTAASFAWVSLVANRGWDASFHGEVAPGPAIVRATFLLAIALIIAACVLPLRIAGNELASLRRGVIIAGRAVAAAIFLGATSAEAALITSRLTTDPTTQAATISIWWAIIAVGAVVAGFVWPVPPVRRLGLALLGIAAIKMVVFDLADVSPVARIASFITLGVLMLAVAVIYGRISRHLEPASPTSTTPPASAR